MPDADGINEAGFYADTGAPSNGPAYEAPAIESRVPVRAPLIGVSSLPCCTSNPTC